MSRINSSPVTVHSLQVTFSNSLDSDLALSFVRNLFVTLIVDVEPLSINPLCTDGSLLTGSIYKILTWDSSMYISRGHDYKPGRDLGEIVSLIWLTNSPYFQLREIV